MTITNHGRAELVVLDAEEYERLPRLDSRVAMPVEALSEADLDRLEQSKIPEGTKKLDHLTRESAADDVRYDDPEPSTRGRRQMFGKIHTFAGPFLGPCNAPLLGRRAAMLSVTQLPSRAFLDRSLDPPAQDRWPATHSDFAAALDRVSSGCAPITTLEFPRGLS